MTNADKFKAVFGIYSEEFWAKPEQDMLSWINSEYQEPQTNADRIRSMTDAELAEWFGMSERMCPDGFSETIDCDACPEVCTGHWLLWLKEEVKDDSL